MSTTTDRDAIRRFLAEANAIACGEKDALPTAIFETLWQMISLIPSNRDKHTAKQHMDKIMQRIKQHDRDVGVISGVVIQFAERIMNERDAAVLRIDALESELLELYETLGTQEVYNA